MKKLFTLLFCSFIFLAKSQTPQKISYQGIARSTTGQLVVSQSVGIKFDLHQGSASGTIVFSEAHSTGTNPFGLFTLAIGSINPSSFASINWASGPYFLEVSIDPAGGSAYTSVGNQQLMSVPYALYAGSAPAPAVSFTNNILSVGGNTTSISSVTPTININAPNTVTNPSAGVYSITVPSPSSYTLTTNSNTITINNGTAISTATVPVASPYTLTANSNSITLDNGTTVSTATIASAAFYTLTATSNTLTLDNGTSVSTATIPVASGYTLSSVSNSITLDNGTTISTVTVPTSPVYTLSANSNSITLDNGTSVSTVTVPAASLYTLSANSNSITLDNGTSVSTATVPVYSAGSGINISTTGVITNTASATSLTPAYNGQFLYYNQTLAKWDSLPQDRFFYNEANNSFGIGTNNPSSNFHVIGAGRFTSSVTMDDIYTNQAHLTIGTFTNSGDVLTNDGTGNAIWQTPPTPSLTYNSGTNVLSLNQGTTVTTATLNGTGSNTVSIVGSGLASVTPTTGSNFTVSVVSPTFATNGPTSITGSYPNYTVNSAASPSTTLVQGNNVTLNQSGNIYTVSAVTPTYTPNGPTTITGTYPNLTINSTATPSTTLVQGNNVTINQSGNTYTVSAAPYSLSSNSNTLTLTNGTVVSTATVPVQSAYVGTINNIAVTSNTINLATTAVTAGTYGINASNSVPTFSVDNFGRLTSANQYTPTVAGDVIGSINTSTVSKLRGINISAVTPTVNQVLQFNAGSWTPTTLAPATITGTGTGIATVTTSANNFTVNVPSPAFAPSTGVLSFGANTLNIAPTLSLSGSTLSSGALTNSVSLSNLSVWSNSVGVLHPTTLPNSVAIGTSGPTTGKFEISHNATVSNPTAHFRESAAGQLVRLKFSNNNVAGKFFELASDNNATDNNAAFSINYHNGSNYRPVFLVTGDYKVVVHNMNTALASLHVMDTTSMGGIASEGFNRAGFMVLARNNQPGFGARLPVSAGDELGRLSFSGFNGSSYGSGPKIFARAMEAYTGSGNGSELIFTTVKVGTTSEQEVLKLLANGNVVVNPMQVPNAILHVRGTMRLDSTLTMAAHNSPPYQSAPDEGRIYFDRPSGKFKVSENGGAYVNLIGGGASPWIQGSGIITQNNIGDFVGIGTAAPTSPLHVYGMADPLQITVENTGGNFKTGYHIKTALSEWFMGQDGPASTGFSITDKLAATTRLQIDQIGNVGINVTNPGYRLTVVENTNSTPAIYSNNSFSSSVSTAHGIQAMTNSTHTLAAAVYGNNNGAGPSIYGIKQVTETGVAGRFENLNTSNAADAMFVLNNGIGAAVHAVSGPTVSGGTNVALLLDGGHVKTVGNTPAIATLLAGTASIIGNDIVGTYLITSTASTTVDQNIVNVTFNKPYSSAPNVMLFGNNGATFNAKPYVTSVTTTGFTITFNGSVAPGTYSIKYLVIQ